MVKRTKNELKRKLEKKHDCKISQKCNGIETACVATFVVQHYSEFKLITKERTTNQHIQNEEYIYNIINNNRPPSGVQEYVQ